MEYPINQSVITLKGRVVTKGRGIINFVKSQPLLDAHRQYLWTFLTLEVSTKLYVVEIS